MRMSLWAFWLVLAVSAGCASIAEPVPNRESSSVNEVSTSDIEVSSSINVAPRGEGWALKEGWSAEGAIDGVLDTMWNSRQNAPVWYLLTLDGYYMADRIELVVSQHQPGPTTHEVWLEDDSHTLTLYKQFESVHTENGHVLEVELNPPRPVNKVYILTSQSQGWVAWWEIRVFAAENPVEPQDPVVWTLKKVATGLEQPVRVRHAGDWSGRLFVIEKSGRVLMVENGVVSETPFLDIADRVVSEGTEQGLFDIAFPPTFPDSKQFYASYTNADGNTVISRFATTADGERGDPDSEETVLTIDQPHAEHNGGQMAFGPQDGYLYIGSGDGGGDRNLRILGEEQTKNSSLLGKILRIDVESMTRPYGIPADNPYVDSPGYRPEIWALGLRNPWGFAFDPQNGDLYIPDTGAFEEEEVNYQAAKSSGGEHYGWPIWEGNYCVKTTGMDCELKELALPVTGYNHGNGCAVVGGAVHEGTFYYADFCRGRVWGLQRRGEGWESELLIDGSTPISSIGIDEAGNLYATGYGDGILYVLERPVSE